MPTQVNPGTGTLFARALVAQGIEQRFPKPCVAGSNPAGGTSKICKMQPDQAIRVNVDRSTCAAVGQPEPLFVGAPGIYAE
jgi:hypothetical protein